MSRIFYKPRAQGPQSGLKRNQTERNYYPTIPLYIKLKKLKINSGSSDIQISGIDFLYFYLNIPLSSKMKNFQLGRKIQDSRKNPLSTANIKMQITNF